MHVNLFFCEGLHDVSFLVRMLKDNGFVDLSDGSINNIPDKDLASIIVTSLKTFTYDEQKNLKQKPFVPTILLKGSLYVLIYPTGGHLDKFKAYPSEDLFLKTVTNFHSLKLSELFNYKIQTLKVNLFYDADESAKAKLKAMNNYLKSLELFQNIGELAHSEHVPGESFDSIGCYLFMNENMNSGCLEDILIDILANDHKKPLEDSQIFIDKNTEKTGPDYNRGKAIIGIIGQLEKSGMGNGPIIAQTKLFKNKLNTESCKRIYSFIQQSF